MALKPHQYTIAEDISFFVTSITGPDSTRMERGGVVVAAQTYPSGAALDSNLNVAEYATNPSGRVPIGVLMNDFVNIDQSRQQLNPYKEEAQIGTKAVIMRKGEIHTNMITPNAATGNTPYIAYLGASGLFTQISGAQLAVVGQFMSRADSDGYAKIYIDPQI